MTADAIAWRNTRLVDHPDGPALVDDRGTIAHWRICELVVDGVAVEGETTTDWEIDEATHTVVAESVRATMRHSLDQTWSIRILVQHTGDDSVRVDRLALTVDAGDDWTVWAACGGAEAMVTVIGHDGQLLGFTVLQGELRRDRDRLVIEDLQLSSGDQVVVRIRGDWHITGTALARHRPSAIGATDWWEVDAVVELDHPDQALLGWSTIPDGADLVPHEGARTTEVEAMESGWITVEFAGPRGRMEVGFGFAPRLADLVDDFVARAEPRWSGRQGLHVDSVAEGVILQRHDRLGLRGRMRFEDKIDALDRLIERMVDEGPLAAMLLAEHAMRMSDPGLAVRARDALAATPQDQAPIVAALPVMAALVMAGLEPTPPVRPSADPAGPAGSASDVVAAALATAIANPDRRVDAVSQLGAHWGIGLHGQRLAELDLVGDARLLVLASLLSEFDPPQPSGWVVEWEELLARQHCRLRGELWLRLDQDPRPVAEALAWLVLATEPTSQ